MKSLRDRGVDSRPYFYPISDMPMYSGVSTPIAHSVSVSGLNLPSYVDLSRKDVAEICECIRQVLHEMDLI
jgi:perosamine synthetase